jgi:hypothetical protein
MTDRKQPVCKGTDSRGELIWGFIPMAEWQRRTIQALAPIPYVGDFLAFWMKRTFADLTGYESESPNLDFREQAFKHLRKSRSRHKGD